MTTERSSAEKDTPLIDALRAAARHPHKGPNDTDASMLREAARRLRDGFEPGWSWTRRTVAEVIETVAALIETPAAPLAVTYQSPGGRSLTRCCCDRTTARLVVCPVHPDATPIPPGGSA